MVVQRQLDLWFQRAARALIDFIAIQIAGALALAFVGARALPGGISEGTLSLYYFHTFLPLSLVFPLIHTIFGLYTKLRGYTLGHKLRRAAASAFVATLLLVFVSFLTSQSQLPRSAAVLFGLAAMAMTTGVRWCKDWLLQIDSQVLHSVSELAPLQETVLVVGGAGYIGSLVIGKLLALGFSVRLLDNLLYGDGAIRSLLANPKLEFMKGDCRNIEDVVRAMKGVRNVIHLAAIVGDPACAENDENALQTNYAATRMMLEIAKGNGVERFLFASSCSVYGASESIMDEQSETIPISLYAETKLHSERVLLETKSSTFHPIILRFATVFGLAPRPRFDLVVNLLTAKAIQDGVITVHNGDQWRPFIHVRDVAEAVVQAFCAPLEAVSGEIFNVGDDKMNFTLTQVAEKIRRQIPNARIVDIENSDRRNYRVSFRKIRACIGFTARYSIEDGIREITRAYESGHIRDYRHPFYNNVIYLKERGRVPAKTELDVKVMAAFAGGTSRSVWLASAAPILAPIPFEPDDAH